MYDVCVENMYIRDLHQHQWRLPGFPQNGILLDVGVGPKAVGVTYTYGTSKIYVGVGGNVLVLPTSTL